MKADVALSRWATPLTVAALFSPLRRRAQRLIDHRFNRARYDADATVAAYGSVQPSHAAIWIPRERAAS